MLESFDGTDARSGPSTRYQGSKRKLGSWFLKSLEGLRFTSVVDLMAGTGSLSYLLKSKGKRVVANDYLHANYATLLAFVQNSSIKLSDSEVDWLLSSHQEVHYSSFVTDTFDGFYFTRPENVWLDLLACNLGALRASTPSELQYKKAIAQHSLVQACLMKRPFNLFHRKNLYLRTADVKRTFGNKTTWDTPFPDLFKRLVRESNEHVFGNGQNNLARNQDVKEVRAEEADLVYIDPPYFRSERDRSQSNYRVLYHFVEGLSQYDRWPELLDTSRHLKPLKTNGFSTEGFYSCERSEFKKHFLSWLTEVIKAWPNSQIAISYKQPGIPGQHSITRLLEKSGRKVSVRTRTYCYALNHHNGTPRHNVELLFLGT